MIKKQIPNLLTGANLFCGALACISFLNGENLFGVILILASLVFDFFDGFVARILGVNSELGKQLDSLADVISFGLVPGIIVYHALEGNVLHPKLSLIGLIIPVFSAFRLAKFNLDTRQSDQFIGLPTPANTIVFLTIPLVAEFGEAGSIASSLAFNPYVLISFTVLFSILLVAEIPLLALKFKSFHLKDNYLRYLLLISSVILILAFSFLAGLFIILLYLILSMINNLRKR